MDGERDLLHGGTISSSVVMAAKLKQCSRYAVVWKVGGAASLVLDFLGLLFFVCGLLT